MREQAGLGPADPAPAYDDGRLSVKPADYVATADGRVLNLTARELAILAELARKENRVVTRQALLEVVWGGDEQVTERTVDSWVARLRGKLAEALPDRSYIHTHFGLGYRFGAESAPASDAAKTNPPPHG